MGSEMKPSTQLLKVIKKKKINSLSRTSMLSETVFDAPARDWGVTISIKGKAGRKPLTGDMKILLPSLRSPSTSVRYQLGRSPLAFSCVIHFGLSTTTVFKPQARTHPFWECWAAITDFFCTLVFFSPAASCLLLPSFPRVKTYSEIEHKWRMVSVMTNAHICIYTITANY